MGDIATNDKVKEVLSNLRNFDIKDNSSKLAKLLSDIGVVLDQFKVYSDLIKEELDERKINPFYFPENENKVYIKESSSSEIDQVLVANEMLEEGYEVEDYIKITKIVESAIAKSDLKLQGIVKKHKTISKTSTSCSVAKMNKEELKEHTA